jgi:hypothetical protein
MMQLAQSPESRRLGAAGQRPTAPRAGPPQRWAREHPPAEPHHKPQTAAVAAPPPRPGAALRQGRPAGSWHQRPPSQSGGLVVRSIEKQTGVKPK